MNHMFNSFKNRFFLSLIALLASITSSCMESKAATDIDSSFVIADGIIAPSDNTIKLVNAVFYKSFIGGDWRFKGAIRAANTINAYIQIPKQLDMSQSDQENYLKVAICPSALNKALWNEIKGSKLAVHIYTQQRKQSTSVICDNASTV